MYVFSFFSNVSLALTTPTCFILSFQVLLEAKLDSETFANQYEYIASCCGSPPPKKLHIIVLSIQNLKVDFFEDTPSNKISNFLICIITVLLIFMSHLIG